MLDNIPKAREFPEVSPEQLVSMGSAKILPIHWLQLARWINDIFALDAGAAGIAITHGTATLEEMAYFLAVKDRRPVVVTGAMRPPTGMGTDSDINLLDYIRVAAAPQSGGCGVLTVLNHEIQTARDMTKINSYRLETFRSRKLGSLGYAESDEQVVFYRSPAKSHAVDSGFDVTGVEQLRRVDMACLRGSQHKRG